MTFSGLVQVRSQGREKHYWLKPEQWSAFLPATGEFPAWITWPPLFLLSGANLAEIKSA